MDWEEIVEVLTDNGIDFRVDMKERFFICPECREPILEEDYNEFDDYLCPVCENDLLDY